VDQERSEAKGGILADEMGLGKTAEIISLTVEHRAWNVDKNNKPILTQRAKQKNLIICPASIIAQWESEIRRFVLLDDLEILIYHGTMKRKSNIEEMILDSDYILTTYNTVVVDYKKSLGNTKAPLYRVKFHRIILDEAHIIKNRLSQASIACPLLKSNFKWCLTGTPSK
jgi:DNA repair protein RAD16